VEAFDVECAYHLEDLFGLYCIAYQSKEWFICDLVADTIVAAFGHKYMHKAPDKWLIMDMVLCSNSNLHVLQSLKPS
jgi:DNA-directed RNA polymerase specialized sigma24 family protein